MKIRNKIAAGFGLAALLCSVIAANKANTVSTIQPQVQQQKNEFTSPNSKYTVKRVEGVAGNLSVVKDTAQPVAVDLKPRLAKAPGPQHVVLPPENNGQRAMADPCGNASVTQNSQVLVLIGAGTVACSQNNGAITVENAWARCYTSDFFSSVNPDNPGNLPFVFQCMNVGIEQNNRPSGAPFTNIDLRISIDTTNCPPDDPTFGGPVGVEDWTMPPAAFNVIHEQQITLPLNFSGLFNVRLTKLLVIPAGADIIVEVHAGSLSVTDGGDNGAFRIGSNDANLLDAAKNVLPLSVNGSETFLWSDDCGVGANYASTVSLGAGFTAEFVMELRGTFGASNITGACCNNAAGTCADTTLDLCQGIDDRFAAGELCPAAGSPFPAPTDPAGGPFTGPPCGTLVSNDDCLGAIDLSNFMGNTGSVSLDFDSSIAKDPPPGFVTPGIPAIDDIHRDVWFRYTVQQSTPPSTAGRLIISTLDSRFDTIVSVYRLVDQFPATPGNQFGTDAQICNSITLDDGLFAVFNSVSDDIPNRPPALVNPNTYDPQSFLNVKPSTVAGTPGDTFYLQVGSRFVGVGGAGTIRVTYNPEQSNAVPDPWGNNVDGRCCFIDGTCQTTSGLFPAAGLMDCQAQGGFFTMDTNFYHGRNPADLANDPNDPNINQLAEFSQVGCKVFPCPAPGEACWNAIDLNALLADGMNGTVTRLIRKKLYYKYTLDAGQSVVIDTCGSQDFDTLIEVLKPTCMDNTLRADGQPIVDAGNPIDGTPAGSPNDMIVLNDQDADPTNDVPLFNDDCVFDNTPENLASRGASDPVDGAVCFNGLNGAETDSCLCLTANGNTGGLLAGSNTIIICIGAFNPDRQTSGVNAIDPITNPTFDAVLSSITVRKVAQCFSCVVTPPMGAIAEGEAQDCAANPPTNGFTNEGCSSALSISGLVPGGTTPIAVAGNGQTIISGTSGFFQPPNAPPAPWQIEDQDWYEINLTQRKLITWRLMEAEFSAEIALLRAGNPEACNTTGFVLRTQGPCDQDTLNDLTVDCCPGRYFLTIRALPPFKPADCGAAYVVSLNVAPAPVSNCCPGDTNNDGIINALDIQRFIDDMLNPPQLGLGLQLGGCGIDAFCRADMNADGALGLGDVPGFVTVLLVPPDCVAMQPPPCDDAARCQLPDRQGAVRSDLNIDQDINNPQNGPPPNFTLNSRAADSFTPTESGMITDVCWWGVYRDLDAVAAASNVRDCAVAPTDNFTMSFWTNAFDAQINDNCPQFIIDSNGPMPARFPVSPMRTLTGQTVSFAIGDSVEYQYTATLPQPVAVQAGTCYWMEIRNDTTGGRCVWDWETSAVGDNRHFQQTKANQPQLLDEYDCLRDQRQAAGDDLAFCLNLLITDTGCNPDVIRLGRCCFGTIAQGNVGCVVTTSDDCAANFGGLFTVASDCSVPCPPAQCQVVCQPGDMMEHEGCGFDENGGCDRDDRVAGDSALQAQLIVDLTTIPVFDPVGVQPIPVTDAALTAPIKICGTAPTGATVNSAGQLVVDNDWYQIDTSLNNPNGAKVSIVLTLEAGFDATVNLLQLVANPNNPPANSNGCNVFVDGVTANVDVNGVGDCQTVALSACLDPGKYIVNVDGSFTQGVGCLDATYRLTISGFPCCVLSPTCPPFVGVHGVQETEIVPAQTNNGCAQGQGAIGQFEPFIQNGININDTTDPAAPSICNPPFAPGFLNGAVVFCGTTWADNNDQDEDWWGPIVLAQDTLITFSLRSEFSGTLEVAEVGDAAIGNSADCLLQNLKFSNLFAFSGVCDKDTFTECFKPGNWAIRIRAGGSDRGGIFSGTPPNVDPAARNHYVGRVTCLGNGCLPVCAPGSNGQLPEIQGVPIGNVFNPGGPVIFATTINSINVGALGSDLNALSNTRSADNFIATSGGDITSVTWWGFYLQGTGDSCTTGTRDCSGLNPPQLGFGPDDFTITFYNDDNPLTSGQSPFLPIRLPGSVLVGGGPLAENVDFTVAKSATGRLFQTKTVPEDCVDEVEYTATLNTPVTVAPGACQWLEIANNTSQNCLWFWETSEDGDSAAGQEFEDPAAPGQGFPVIVGDPYTAVAEFPSLDLAFCVSIKTGPAGCFVFNPAVNDTCAGAIEITGIATFSCPGTLAADFDLINFSLQANDPIAPCIANLFGGFADCSGVPESQTIKREGTVWYKVTPTANLSGVTFTLGSSTAQIVSITVFPAGTACGASTQGCIQNVNVLASACGVPGPLAVAAPITPPRSLTAGQTYLIVISYPENSRTSIGKSLPQQLIMNCP